MGARAASFALVLVVAARASAAQEGPPLRLTLGDAVRRAAGEAPLVELAGFRTDAARAQVRQQRAALLPQLSAGAGWLNRTFNRASLGFDFPTPPGAPPPPDLIGPFDNMDARLRLSQTLFDYASLVRIGAARAQLDGAEAEAAGAAEAAAQATALAYLRAARAAALLAARRADSLLAAELVALAQAQLEAGVGTAIDVTRARTQLVATQGAIVVAGTELARARIDLARSLGLDARAPLELVDSLTDRLAVAEVSANRDSAVARALGARPDLAVELARETAARRAARAITAERLPRLELAADYGVNGPALPDAIATRQIAVQVSVPLVDGFRREARLAEQRAAVQAAALRERDLRRQVLADVDAALLDLESAAAQQRIAAERRRLAEEELAQARERFAAGVAGNIEVINAQLSLIAARDGDIAARFAAAAARVALARATGMARTLQ